MRVGIRPQKIVMVLLGERSQPLPLDRRWRLELECFSLLVSCVPKIWTGSQGTLYCNSAVRSKMRFHQQNVKLQRIVLEFTMKTSSAQKYQSALWNARTRLSKARNSGIF